MAEVAILFKHQVEAVAVGRLLRLLVNILECLIYGAVIRQVAGIVPVSLLTSTIILGSQCISQPLTKNIKVK